MSQSPRILMVSYWYPPSVGGLPQQAHGLARTLVQQGVQVRVVTASLEGQKNFEICEGVPVHRLFTLRGGYRRRVYTWLLPLAIFLIQHRKAYDIWHVHQALFPAALTVVIAKLFGKKVIVKCSGTGESGNMAVLRQRWLGSLARALIQCADGLVSLTEPMTAELCENGFDLRRIVRIPNGVDFDTFRRAAPLAGLEGRRIVITVGRMTFEKGNDILIRAWPRVVEKMPDIQLYVLAAGPEREVLQQLARQLGVHPTIHFVGSVPQAEVAQYLAASEVFVLPSRHEGMSNALLEALAAGKACLVSDIPDNQSLVQSGVNGLTFKSEDTDDLATQLIALLQNSSVRARLGAAGQQVVLDSYSIEAIARQYLRLYQVLFKGRSPLAVALGKTST